MPRRPKNDPPVYAIYCRLSRLRPQSKRGRRRGEDETVARQEALCRKYAADKGLALSEDHIYVDNGISAWKLNGKRPGWDAMMAAGRRHEFDGMLAWKIDRFNRRMRDAVDLVEMAEKVGIVVDGPGSGQVDLSGSEGRQTFYNAANAAETESSKTSERVKATFAEMTAQGVLLPGGGRGFGFDILSEVENVPDDVTAVLRPDEVEIVREVATRMVQGETLVALAADLTQRGIKTARGRTFNGPGLGSLLSHQKYGGWVVLNGKRVGRMNHAVQLTDGTFAETGPVLDEETFEQVQATLSARRKGPRVSGRFPLTGIMRCGNPACSDPGHLMAGSTAARRLNDGAVVRKYVCAPVNGGCSLTIRAAEVEAIVRDRVLADLADVDARNAISGEAAAFNEARAAALAVVQQLDEELAELEAKKAEGQIRQPAYDRAKPIYDRRIAKAELALAAFGDQPMRTQVLPSLTVDEWGRMTPAEKRSLIADLALTITILPNPPGASTKLFQPGRVVIEP